MKRLPIVLLVLLVFAGCGHSNESAVTGGRHAWTHPGVLRFTASSDPDTLSPLVGNLQIDYDLAQFWGGFLFNYNDHDRLDPELATVEPTLGNHGISPDGKTIVYHLRHGVKWQDGAPFDADDVIFTWRAVMNPANNVPNRDGYDRVTHIDKRDAYTIAVHLNRPYAPFIATFLTEGANPFPVYPRHLLASLPDLNRVAFNNAPVGTGPFIVKEWHRGNVIRMEANPHYWRGAPKLKEVDYYPIADDNTILTQMKTHELDLWYNAPHALYDAAKAIPDTHALVTPFVQFAELAFNVTRPALRDVRVRRALMYATDRARIARIVGHGVDVIGEGDLPPSLWAHNTHLPLVPYDLAKANALLDAAGWLRGPDGIRRNGGHRLELEFVIASGRASDIATSVLVQDEWRRAGIDLLIKPYPTAILFATYGAGGILQRSKFDVATYGWISGVDPDESTLVTCNQRPPNGQNDGLFCDPAIDRLEQVARSNYDQAARKRAYDTIQLRLADELPGMTLWNDRQLSVESDDLHGYRPAHAVTGFWNPWEYSI